MSDWGVFLVVGVVLVFMLAVVGMAVFADDDNKANRFSANCAAAGGHVYAPSYSLCLSKDGGVLEVYP